MGVDNVVDTTDKNLPKKDRIIAQALDRFRMSVDYEKENRVEALDDLEMLAGRNHWPANVVAERNLEGRPTLVINKLPGFANRVANEGRINKVAIKVLPNGSGASAKQAELFNGLIRSIERNSSAASAYQNAHKGAVQSGFGYFRIHTTFTDETSFDQEIVVKRVKNNMTVYLDPYHVELDGSDSRFAFVTEMVSPEEYKARYPNVDPPSPLSSELSTEEALNWTGENRIRIGEYWVKVPKRKTLHLLSDGRTVDDEEWQEALPGLQAMEKIVHLAPASAPIAAPGQPAPVQGGQAPVPVAPGAPPMSPEVPATPPAQTPAAPTVVEGPAPEGSGYPEEVINPVPTITRSRTVDSFVIDQYLIDGTKIIDGPNRWAGMYIPIVPVWGEEVTVDEKTYRRGVIRFAKDPQRMYNYFRTAATETVALTPKAPYVVEAQQIEGFEEEWTNANRTNKPYLPYNNVAGVVPPSRQVVTQTAIGEITESNISGDEMKDTTSIQDASLGARGNEVSGRAIQSRQSQSDVVNYTYHDNLALAIEFAGKIMVDLIPRIYDTERQVTIIDPEDNEIPTTVNQVVMIPATGEKVVLNDLTQGRYKVTTVAGPSFNTQREEAAASMLDFVRTAPDTARFVMDLIAENQNWPGAVKIANRLKKLLPPGIDDEGPPPPQPPGPDDVIKDLKAKSMALGNEKKKLDIVDKRRELTDETVDLAKIVKLLKDMGVKMEDGDGGQT